MPDLTVIEGGGPTGRSRVLAEQEFEFALREAAANMLRIIRGAGKPYALLQQMNDVVAAAVKFRDATGQLPTDILETVLRVESEADAIWEKRRADKIDEGSIGRWHADGTFDGMHAEDCVKAGVLQIVASQLVGQKLQQRAGETQMRDGIKKVTEARQTAKRYWDAQQKASTGARTTRKKRKHSPLIVL